MAVLNKFFSSVFVAIVYASIATAAPGSSNPSTNLRPTTHRTRSVGKSGLTVNAYYPPSTYETFGEGVATVQSAGATLQDNAVAYAKQKLGVNDDGISYRDGYTNEAGSFAYLRQKHNGIEFANSVANVAFKDNRVVAFGSSFVKPTNIAPSEPKITVEEAIATAESALGGKYNQHPAKLQYLAMDDGSAALVRVVQIQNKQDQGFSWHEVSVDAQTGKVVSVVDFVNDATYRVLPINKEYPTEGFETLVDPEDYNASPKGWLNDGTKKYTTTQGNNAFSFKLVNDVPIPSSQSSNGKFVYNWNPNVEPTVPSNVDVARVNAFYIANTMHDIAYRYGFTECSYNFQANNFGNTGAGNDQVLVSVQDPEGLNNAFFATPPDGQNGYMAMFLWNFTTPLRDGAIENDIVIHEYTHGITNRMTGGGTGSCLQTLESGGMGEGWSDAFADWNAQGPKIKDFELGVFVYGQNIRSYPYSTNKNTNPLIYSSLQNLFEVHQIGEVWANMLHNVLAAFVDKYGWSKTARTNPKGSEGNVQWLHLFMDALSLQPCNPTFTEARDAWLQADYNRYKGKNKCLIWKAFASRGLGSKAKPAYYVDSFDVPKECSR